LAKKNSAGLLLRTIFYLILLSINQSIYIKMGKQMFVCPTVGMWRANGNPNPCTNLDEILHTHPACPRKVLVQF